MVVILEYLVLLLFIILATILAGPVGFVLSLVAIGYVRGPKPKPRSTTSVASPQPNLTAPSLREIEEDIFNRSTKLKVPEILYLEYREYLKTPEWKQLRASVFKRDNHRCVRCGYIGPKKQTHHTHYDGIFSMTFSLEQLETTCAMCHEDIHKGILPMKKD